MPIFIPNGPVIPDQLVQDLEDDRVVLFCGAGISVGAGLPDFRGLVEYAYTECGVALPSKNAAEWQWLDRMLGTLETTVAPSLMRHKIAERLSVDPKNTELHEALLRLARLKRGDEFRLVTTNFDRYFEHVDGHGLQLGDSLHVAPTVPVPRNDTEMTWQSVVHLHGRVREPFDHNHDLILTSADFGRAYLTDGWAARFVARLFEEFSVVFIGYSLNDPVLRYMTDALAAETISSRRRVARPPSYIFVPFNARNPRDRESWVNKGLEPIFYHDGWKHRKLRETITAWARQRDDWLESKKSVLSKAGTAPLASASPSDLSNFMWTVGIGQAQDDPLGAQQLAKLNVPIEWLPKIEEHEAELIKKAEDARKALKPGDQPVQPAQQFPVHALLVRPGNEGSQLSKTAWAVGNWITLNLNDRSLIDWVCQKARQGLFLHGEVIEGIRHKLRSPEIQIASTRRLFWRIVCVGERWRPLSDSFRAGWDLRHRLNEDPNAIDIRAEFLTVLQPYLQINPAFPFGSWSESGEGDNEDDQAEGEERLSKLADIEVRLVGDENIHSLIQAIDELDNPDSFLADFSDTLTTQLNIALHLWALAEKADEGFDIGTYHRPSIEPHDQNTDFHSWTWLIEFLWRGWLHIDETSEDRSRRLIARWRDLPYPTFQRLALAAIAKSRHISASEKLEAVLRG